MELPQICGCHLDGSLHQIFTEVAGGVRPLIQVQDRTITCCEKSDVEHFKVAGAFVPKDGRLYFGGKNHWVALATYTEDRLIDLANWCQYVNHHLGVRLPRNVQDLDFEPNEPVPA
jgi:hypothetical protein